ncbi:hypothetical protein TREMEDRAFT_38649 [Tremella mesenterica DSM 1558]|uniref:uncharacterized protein n=1 Tax=Tremella mesenterica (strain ATCC 24925 / CBS 8224 / DSM 1558 / NBRC 9311 / NRRL Y-6157 / RJB 2259-6 / UBC 559-6) TaxID=578456 RepID=UPI0003F4A36A|nr:uncharacterized protein TREMEDRAFT_38649 [Tremella mesenterica DSM 1558]EIW69982.1 hypothetical protein TREMEDRAFT_38649 [Tremella mesenterica DSM 1558]
MEKTDLEKGGEGNHAVKSAVYDGKLTGVGVPAQGFWGKLDNFNRRLEAKLGIESRGIERVPETARTDRRLYGNTFIWLSANCVLPTFGLGVLGPLVFYMNLGDCLLTIFFFNALTALIPAFMSTFGPKLGLRQMTVSRFSWGFWGAKLVALLNCIACVGWSIVNTIAGAQALETVADYHISAAVGVVIIALATLVIGLCGYKFVHRYEQFSWIPTAITFLVLLGVSAKHLVSLPMPTGQAEAASVLSFGGAIFGFTVGWSSLASDYNVYMPAEAKSWKVFGWTYLGLIVPTVLVMWLGAAVASAALVMDDWFDAYQEHELGGLLGAVLITPLHGGGKFFMVLLVLSVVANNIINVYSMGLSVSVIAVWLAALPRLIWPFVITAIYIPLAIVGANHFADSLEDFLNVLGYWLAIYSTVVIEEHIIFRKRDFASYRAAETWNRSDLLPVSFAAILAGCVGVAGAVLGMAQIWYIGPIGKKVGGTADIYGGDIGFELAAAFTGLMYPPLRWLELKYMRR